MQENAPGASVILYGSYARGDYNEESDIDLLILLDKDNVTRADERKISHSLYDIELQIGTIISPMVYSKHAWTTHRVTPFYENLNREGKML